MASSFRTDNDRQHESHAVSSRIFQAVVEEDYDGLTKVFAENARNSVVSYLSMQSRWSRQQDSISKSEEKIDEFSQHLKSPSSVADPKTENSATYFHSVLQQLSIVISDVEEATTPDLQEMKPSTENNGAVDQMIHAACSTLADSRPPPNLCVYDQNGSTTPQVGRENDPPIFDGSVANATPAPHGGVGASGGTGTILHLVCAMDRPLMLAFLLIMGADGRANHTAFRRLMIHEAACNGSINCLTLLLEMGDRFSKEMEKKSGTTDDKKAMPFFPDTIGRSASPPSLSSPRLNARPAPPVSINRRSFGRTTHSIGKIFDDEKAESTNCILILSEFKRLANLVKEGNFTELQAARSLLTQAHLSKSTRTALIRSCSFRNDNLYATPSFLRPFGCADGHGNTPLHWASFKNETKCVELLLHYNADPNARAHPSGWTPLHDAAYSNSSACIKLLSDKGAQVDAKANSGATPLCFAAQEDASEAAQLLLDRGADLSSRCAGPPPDDGAQYHYQLPNHPHSRFSGYTPLHYCAHYNAQRASIVLLRHPKAKAAMEVADLSGRLPIHVAVARGSSDVLRALLHAGARVDTPPTGSPTSVTRLSPSAPSSFGLLPPASVARRSSIPEEPRTPNRYSSSSTSTSPVTSPVLRSMIPSQPISSSKPWNCLSQQAIDECKELISKSEQSWSPDHHLLFTPQDRKAVMELLRVGKRLEQNGTGIFIDLWPTILGFCGRGWFETEEKKLSSIEDVSENEEARDYCDAESNEINGPTLDGDDNYLALPSLSN